MRNRNILKIFIAFGVVVSVACLCSNFPTGSTPPPDPENTATFTPQSPTDTATPTPTVEAPVVAAPADRCGYFEGVDMSFIFHTMVEGDETMTMYVHMPGGVPGLEKEMPGDPGPYLYSAMIGGLESFHCDFYDYEGRLYCVLPLNKPYYNTAQKFDLYVEGCDISIFGHPYLSIIVETQPPVPEPPDPEPSCPECHPP